jgi:hypothetical protein
MAHNTQSKEQRAESRETALCFSSIGEEIDLKRWYNKAQQGSTSNCGLPIEDCGVGMLKQNPKFPIRNPKW